MNFDNLINGLKEKGIEAEGITVCKNGCECLGLRVLNPDRPGVSPIIYYSPEETLEHVLDRVSTVMADGMPDFCLDCLDDPAYIAGNVYFSIQKKPDDGLDVLKRDCLNLELVLRVPLSLEGSMGSIKFPRFLLERCDMEEDVLWAFATENMKHRYIIQGMAEALGLPEDMTGVTPFYVCTTDNHTNGASVLAIPEVIRRFCAEKRMEKVYILPSSTEEVLLCPADLCSDTSVLADIVKDVNAACVDPLIQLEPVVYCYDFERDELCISASAEGGR